MGYRESFLFSFLRYQAVRHNEDEMTQKSRKINTSGWERNNPGTSRSTGLRAQVALQQQRGRFYVGKGQVFSAASTSWCTGSKNFQQACGKPGPLTMSLNTVGGSDEAEQSQKIFRLRWPSCMLEDYGTAPVFSFINQWFIILINVYHFISRLSIT